MDHVGEGLSRKFACLKTQPVVKTRPVFKTRPSGRPCSGDVDRVCAFDKSSPTPGALLFGTR